MFKNLLKKFRDKPVDALPIPPIERGEFANPSEIVISGSEIVSSGAGSNASSDPPVSIDPEEEKERNRQYKADLGFEAFWVNARIEQNACPREEMKNFEIVGKIGSGGYGEVYKVKYCVDQKFYALKVQSKRKLCESSFVEFAVREKKFMFAMEFEFILKAYFAFKDARNLYLVMDYACLGDVSSLYKYKLPELGIKFLIVQCILGIEYLHACDIAHRDIKGQNIFIFEDGYIKIGDFGLSKKFRERTYTCVGTHLYMAPEILRQRGYRKGVDWWAMGIVLYRLIYYHHPFAELHHNRYQVLESLKRKDLTFPKVVYPGSPVNGLLSGLLEKDPSTRLGMLEGGPDDIKAHEWFSDVCFCEVIMKTTKLPSWRSPVEPKFFEQYYFLPEEGERDFRPNLFKEF